jgi:hypothetical protein
MDLTQTPLLGFRRLGKNPHSKLNAIRPVENLRESLHSENSIWLRSATPLRFSTGLTALNEI